MVGNSRGVSLAHRRAHWPADVTRINPASCFGPLGANGCEGGHARAGERLQATAAQVVAQFLPCLVLLAKVRVARSARASGRARVARQPSRAMREGGGRVRPDGAVGQPRSGSATTTK